jgi:shikimate kinase
MKERIYLVGFMGVGKTTVGKKLARRLGYRFVDMDDFFEEKFKIEIHRFFNKYDEPLFRKLEHDRLKKTFEMEGVVVATGGGTPCHHGGIEEISQHGMSIFLEMPPAVIAYRLLHARRKRPLVMGKTGETLTQYIEEKLAERLSCYEKADLKVNAVQVDITALAEEIKRFDVRL